MTCCHFTDLATPCCARGVNLLQLAGGGAFYMVLRLPCIEISNRRGETASTCSQFAASATSTKEA